MLLLALSLTRPAAAVEAPNAVYAELGGSGVAYSLNYERRLDDSLVVRVGGETIKICVFSCSLIAGGVVGVSKLLRPGPHHIELGGTEWVGANEGDLRSITGLVAGYRYQADDGGLIFRAVWTPLMQFGYGEGAGPEFLLPWGGLSIGYGF
jgi:hypothetical protein